MVGGASSLVAQLGRRVVPAGTEVVPKFPQLGRSGAGKEVLEFLPSPGQRFTLLYGPPEPPFEQPDLPAPPPERDQHEQSDHDG